MTRIVRALGIAGASGAVGPTIVIDTFRAFTTAAVLLARGAERLYLESDVAAARELARTERAIAVGEDAGLRPEGFDLGNSPAEAHRAPGVAGRCVVQRSTAGTRSLIAAVNAGAAPVYASSLVVATATALAVGPWPEVTIVSAGLHGSEPAQEDDLTGDFIVDTLNGTADPLRTAAGVASSPRAEVLRHAPWAHPDDVDVACNVDRYDFAMLAVRDDHHRVLLVATDVPPTLR